MKLSACCHLSFLYVLIFIFIVNADKTNTTFKNRIKFKLKDELRNVCSDNNHLPVVKLLNFIATQYLTHCMPVILYDEFFYKSLSFQPVIKQLLKTFQGPIIHGQFSTELSATNINTHTLVTPRESHCIDYIVLSQTLEPVLELLGHQSFSKVVLVPQASLWQITNFLESSASDLFVNLLIIADPSLQLDFFLEKKMYNSDINMYTHELYTDSLSVRVPRLLTSWRCDHLTQPGIALFPDKMMKLNGYQLRIVATEQPPFVYQKFQLDSAGEAKAQWDGLEVRLLKLISAQLNFTLNFQQPTHLRWENTAESVLEDLTTHKADVAIAGVYATKSRWQQFHPSVVHSHDCAVFMTLASVALPKYRAIMGPFRWEVWMAITLAYLLAILPISFSAYHTLRPLLDNPYELENMFWYVFGTFTNCFTFSGKKSWSSGKMNSTRIFIGTYWTFSIIVSAAYTGSIIAFIMLPSFPEVAETAHQLVKENFRLILTNNSDLKISVLNSSDVAVQHLANNLQIVDSVEEALTNVTDSPFFTDYAFLHSREFLKHIIRTNLSPKMSHKKSVFHLGQNCFVPMLVAMMFQPESNLVKRVDVMLMRAVQGGFIDKLVSDVVWDQQKSNSGKLLQVSGGGSKMQPPEDRQLTLDDTQGMFLLMGAGFGLAMVALVIECGIYIWTKQIHTFSLPSIVYSEEYRHIGQRNFQLQNKEDVLHYLSSQGSLLELKGQVHAVDTSWNHARAIQSLTALKTENQTHYGVSVRCPSV